MNLLEQLQAHKDRLQDLESKLNSSDVLSDPRKIREVNEQYAAERDIIEVGSRYESVVKNLDSARTTLSETSEEEMKELAQGEIDELEVSLPILEQEFTVALIPLDPMDNKSIIVEIRAGAGGDESSLFAAELMRSYSIYAEVQGWKTELISASRTDVGGFKEVIFTIKGTGAYSALKYESGVHRVQRVPETEKQGRVHTSTVTVAIMPEVEEVDVQIDPKDLIIEATTSTGAGGQSVNTTYSAVRITHTPSGIMVYCQEERSQKQNKERALGIIRARVYAMEQEKARKEREDERRGQIGTGDRSEKIRTYNFPQDRVTDHRINQNFHNLPGVMSGSLDEIITALKSEEIEQRLKELG
ncbi:MAG: peptide chain release factor 1 [Parcubacteria group bacterium]|nr:peptide chain release factor 1 [Parcubacteria group bacterium]